jgi:hypothetical protein
MARENGAALVGIIISCPPPGLSSLSPYRWTERSSGTIWVKGTGWVTAPTINVSIENSIPSLSAWSISSKRKVLRLYDRI